MSDAKEWFRSVAWSDFMRWATEKREMQVAFLKATGEEVTAESMGRFMDWLTIHHWGLDDAPRLVRERLKSQEPPHE